MDKEDQAYYLKRITENNLQVLGRFFSPFYQPRKPTIELKVSYSTFHAWGQLVAKITGDKGCLLPKPLSTPQQVGEEEVGEEVRQRRLRRLLPCRWQRDIPRLWEKGVAEALSEACEEYREKSPQLESRPPGGRPKVPTRPSLLAKAKQELADEELEIRQRVREELAGLHMLLKQARSSEGQAEPALFTRFIWGIQRVVLRIVNRRNKEFQREQEREQERISPTRVEDLEIPAPNTLRELAERRIDLEVALERAGADAIDRQIIMWGHYYDFCRGWESEAAKQLGLKPATVRKRLQRLLPKLKPHLK